MSCVALFGKRVVLLPSRLTDISADPINHSGGLTSLSYGTLSLTQRPAFKFPGFLRRLVALLRTSGLSTGWLPRNEVAWRRPVFRSVESRALPALYFDGGSALDVAHASYRQLQGIDAHQASSPQIERRARLRGRYTALISHIRCWSFSRPSLTLEIAAGGP
jgi:hypothetical protein